MKLTDEQRAHLAQAVAVYASRTSYGSIPYPLTQALTAIFAQVDGLIANAYQQGKLDGENEQQTLTSQHNLARGKP